MKRAFLLIICAFFVFAGLHSARTLPGDSGPLIGKKYDQWAGVLRVWVAEDTGPCAGSPLPWLNRMAAILEKRRPGVYLHLQTVPAEAIRNREDDGLVPPDMIVYPAGLLTSDHGLVEISTDAPLRAGMPRQGMALPLLMNACAWIYDAAALPVLPANLQKVPAACSPANLNALAALCTGLRPEEGEKAPLPGMDLGLEGAAAATQRPAGSVACRVSPELSITESPREAFASGTAQAFVGDLRDLAKMADASGWAYAVTGEWAYVTEALCCSVLARQDETAAARQRLCQEYIEILLTEGQTDAARTGAMPVAVSASAWSGDPLLAGFEAALDEKRCLCPDFFGNPPDQEQALRFIAGEISADEAAEALRARIESLARRSF